MQLLPADMVGQLFFRLVQTLGTAWLLVTLVFLLSRLGLSRAEQLTLDRADTLEQLHAVADPTAQTTAINQRLGLDLPVFYFTGRPGHWHWHGPHNQYQHWLGGLLHGRLGQSYRDDQPVASHLGPALACTLPLVGLALGLSTALALGLALHLAARPGLASTSIQVVLNGLQAIPLFTLALALLLLLANPDVLNLLPAADLGSTDGPADMLGSAARLVLPLLALVLAALPELTLPLAATLRHELASPYAVAARAKGLTVGQVAWRHALPNAVLPLLTTLAEQLPALVAGAVVVEVLFALPGMGRLLAEAATTHDYPVLLGGLLLVIGARLLALLATDLAHYLLDPRLRTALPA